MSTSKKISIRTAKPEDASFLAQVILMAGRAHVKRGIWEVILGVREEECLAFLQLIAVTKIPPCLPFPSGPEAKGGRC